MIATTKDWRRVLFLLGVALLLEAGGMAQDPAVQGTSERVGRQDAGRIMTPVNQVLTPYGRQLDLPGLRPQALAVAPDGSFLIVSGKTSELLVIDTESGQVRDRVGLPGDEERPPDSAAPRGEDRTRDTSGQLSFTGLVFSPQGDWIYLSNVNGSIKAFSVDANGRVEPSHAFKLPSAKAPRREQEIPSGLAVSPDGKRLYVCGNLSNQLLELNTKDGQVTRTWDVGVAPYDVVLAGGTALVSNWGGRRPAKGDQVGPAGRGTEVRVDPIRHIASEGSVSLVSLEGTAPPRELVTGLHASALAVSPDARFVVCANAGSDHLSVIDVAQEKVVDTVWVKAKPSDLLGASPNALAFFDHGKRLLVANGAQNAVAIVNFRPEERGASRLEGLIPVGWYPGAVACDPEGKSFYVANIKGLPLRPEPQGDQKAPGYNSHQYTGSLSMGPIPPEGDLPALSERVARNLRAQAIAQAALPPRKNQPSRAIPERIGEPSKIRHVVYIIKENRTYDQIFGALGRGRGMAELCIFGEKITPNQHKLVNEFVLLDNTYCTGILSADGHQWSTTAFSTDYMEKSFAGFPRSYPDGMGTDEADALAYSPAGFIWDNAVLHGKSIRNYGEFMAPLVRWRDAKRQGSPDFLACFRQWKGETDDVIFESYPSVESIRAFSPTDYVGWEMAVPDQFRADFVLRELKEYEAKGEFPQLVIICLPNDHTSGTSAGSPTPEAHMADNDLAFGRIVEALSHSSFWKDMAIFAIEDDPQAGWDHISGYRTTAYCISPYARRGAVVSTQYNTTSILRTIEQILGLPPMNQFDASATPMFDCFQEVADTTPFQSVATNIPLDQMNPEPQSIRDPVLRQDALVSARLNFREVDRAPEDVLNRILWRAVRGSQEPYPEWAAGIEDEEEEEEEVDEKDPQDEAADDSAAEPSRKSAVVH